MLEKPRVLGSNHGIDHVRAHLVVIDRDSVFVVKTGQGHRLAVFVSIKSGGLGGVDWLDVFGQTLKCDHSG